MREAHISWHANSIAKSEYASIAKIAHKLEVVAHLDVGEKGIRQCFVALWNISLLHYNIILDTSVLFF